MGHTHATSWDAHAKLAATSFLHAPTKFEFIGAFISLYRWLHLVAGITCKLQGRNVDIIDAYESVSCCIKNLKYVRGKVEKSLIKFSIKPNKWR